MKPQTTGHICQGPDACGTVWGRHASRGAAHSPPPCSDLLDMPACCRGWEPCSPPMAQVRAGRDADMKWGRMQGGLQATLLKKQEVRSRSHRISVHPAGTMQTCSRAFPGLWLLFRSPVGKHWVGDWHWSALRCSTNITSCCCLSDTT